MLGLGARHLPVGFDEEAHQISLPPIGHPRDNPLGEEKVRMGWAMAGVAGLGVLWVIIRLWRRG